MIESRGLLDDYNATTTGGLPQATAQLEVVSAASNQLSACILPGKV
jgi:hypothetical protein